MATKRLTAEEKAQRRERRVRGLCVECGGDRTDGNCSPMYDWLCADCGEARYERRYGQG